MRHRMAQTPGRQLPIRAILGQALSNGDGAAHGVIDRRRARQERIGLGTARRVERPAHRAVRLLPAQNEVNASLNGRPELTQELDITGNQMVMPGARSQVGADVGVEARVLDRVPLVVVEPAAVRELARSQPAVGIHRFVDQATHREGHGGLDVVPGIAVTALEPRDHAIVALHFRDGMRRRQHVATGQDSGHLWNRDLCRANVLCRHAAAPWFGVSGPPRRPGTPRGTFGRVSESPDTFASGLVR